MVYYPKIVYSYSGCANGNEFVVISFEEKTTDIIFEKTEYKDFPIPRLVFGFLVSGNGRIINVRLGVTEKMERLTPKQKCLFIRFRMLADFIFVREVMYYRKIKSLHQLGGLPYYILKMPNNYDYYKESRTKLNLDYRGLLEHLKDKDSQYYYDNVLVETDKTLNDFIAEVNL